MALRASLRARPALALTACLAVAAALAFWNLGFGLPFLFRPDEEVMVGRAVRMALERSLDPLFYVYPPVAFYAFAAAEAVIGALPGHHLGPATAVDPTLEYLAARTVSALAVVAAVGLTWLAGARAYGGRAATVAAAALGVAPIAVREAHFATPDALQLALLALTLWLGFRAGRPRGFALAGVACAAAAGTKYTAGAGLAFLVVLAAWRRPRGAALACVAAAVAAFAVTLPLLLVPTGHGRAFLDGLLFLHGRASSFRTMPPGWIYHATRSLPYGLGPGTLALALAGGAVAAKRRARDDVALLALIATACLPIAFANEDFFRYVLPLAPALCLLAGASLRAVPARALPAAIAASALLLAPSAWNSVEGDRLLGATDTRAQAAAWLDANAPPGSVIRGGGYFGMPYYSGNQIGRSVPPGTPPESAGNAVVDSFRQGRYTNRYVVGVTGGEPCYELLETAPPWQAPMPAAPDAAASFSAGRPGAGDVYDVIDSFYLPIWGFDGIERPGPAIAIRSGC